MKYTDTEMLNWLETQNNKEIYTGRCVWRWSRTGRGWRLHETSGEGFNSVREAIEKAMEDYKR